MKPLDNSITIPRKSDEADGCSYEGLRAYGVEVSQQLSGELWTDYNLHDPGVTILEQLSYALTDVANRSEIPVEELLSDAEGKIDYEGLALHMPDQIMSCRPVTIDDYRKLLFDRNSGIGDAWVSYDPAVSGRVRFTFKRDQGRDVVESADLVRQVRDLYYQQRNLGEDVGAVTAMSASAAELYARVEVSQGLPPAEILANIYYQAAELLSGSPRLYDYSEIYRNGMALDEMFSGPLTEHGYIPNSELVPRGSELDMAAFFKLLNGIEGVTQVNTLHLSLEESRHNVNEEAGDIAYNGVRCQVGDSALYLRVPERTSDVHVELFSNGRKLDVDLESAGFYYKELAMRNHSFRRTKQNISSLYDLPGGRNNLLADYFSLQHQFPAAYGINSFGVPASAPDEVKAKAKQLKGYLLLFEQLIANSLMNLSSIPELFSIRDECKRSYYYQVLDPADVPDIEGIYPEQAPEILDQISRRYDNFVERKSRLVDYLLGLYGEGFQQHSLRLFDFYYDTSEADYRALESKVMFLKHIIRIGHGRGAGFDYSRPYWYSDNVGGLQMRVGLLLGFGSFKAVSLTMPILDSGLRFYDGPVSTEKQEAREQCYQEVMARFRPLLEQDGVDKSGYSIQWRGSAGKDLLAGVRFDKSLLHNGVNSKAYYFVGDEEDGSYRLLFQESDESESYELGSYSTKKALIHSARVIKKLLITLNTESEGMHVVEHVLLSPASPQQDGGRLGGFYNARVTVVLPGWTACCSSRQFRHLAEECIRSNAPAHLHVECLWLEFDAMCQFEILYFDWLEKLREDAGKRFSSDCKCDESDGGELRRSAAAVVEFLTHSATGGK